MGLFHDEPAHPASGPGANSSPADPLTCPVEPEYHLHVDANRDGSVDDDRTGISTWTWGAGNKGAIVLCNNDDDQGASACDNDDTVVNGGNDDSELAPIEIRRIGPPPPGNWEGFLEVAASDAQFFHLFDSRSAGSVAVLGQGKGNSFKLLHLNFSSKPFWLEATRYAGPGFSGEFTLTFRLNKAGATAYTEDGRFRVAPWIMPNHLDHADKVFVVEVPSGSLQTPAGSSDNARFRSDLSAHVSAAGCSLATHASLDLWMQDCLEFGYSNLPGKGFRSVIRAPRSKPLRTFPKTLRTADLGYHEPGSLVPDTTFDSTGNLECTPPVTSAAGKRYPWGRIYFGAGRPGETMDADTQTFLANQVVQEPILIDTNWLTVGHVDEIISIVPAPGPKGFKLLLASPKLAYDILIANRAAHGSSSLLTGRKFPGYDITGAFTGFKTAECTISGFLGTGIPGLSPTAASLESFNTTIQSTLDAIRTNLQSALGLGAADILSVPIIYMPNDSFPTLADALTGGMVNMLVVNSHCVVPKPFGPVVGGHDLFEDDLTSKLNPLGLTVHMLDDWYEYHVLLGEVHCGTNTQRAPTLARWWEFTP